MSKIRPEHQRKLRKLLTRLNGAGDIKDLDIPGADLHALKGEWMSFWSIKVNANWRIVFRLQNGDAFDVDYVDYH